jgi:glycosyltransferase involved in cell wall biosynthesis
MLRIAIVVSHPIQHFCPQYVSFSKADGVRVKVFFGSTLGLKSYVDPNFRTEISWGNLNLESFEHVFLNGDRLIPSDSNIDAASLEGELNEFAPGLLIIYGYFQKLQRRAHRWAVTHRVKLAYISDSELRHKRNVVKEWLKSFFIRRYFSAIDNFFSVGDANEEFYRQHGVSTDKIVRMHFPIDVEAYQESFRNRASLRHTVREKFAVPAERPVLIVVGKLVSWKNQDHLIDALAWLERQGFLVDLFLVGSGQMEESWKEKASALRSSRVHFTGFVSVQDLPAYYAAADVYVHPASIEPHSIAVSEAIYMGLPVIISDRCGSYGPTDDVQEGRNGFVYSFGNIEELSEKIRRLLVNASAMKNFSDRSREIALRHQARAHQGVVRELADILIPIDL